MSKISTKRKARGIVSSRAKRPCLETCQRGKVDYVCEFGDSLNGVAVVGKICYECRKLEFERIFNLGTTDPWFQQVYRHEGLSFPLWHIDQNQDCPLCNFFRSVKVPSREITVTPIYRLCVSFTRREFGAPNAGAQDSTAFMIVPHDFSAWLSNAHTESSGIVMEAFDTPNRFSGRQIRPQVDFSVVKEWLDFYSCKHKTVCKHQTGRKFANFRLPRGFRVIDCSTRKIMLWEEIEGYKPYVALSYVWGLVQEECAASKDELRCPLPRTIEDAIITTTRLGFQYLWIDRYCIPQGMDQDKHTQIQSMNEIYKSSVITIIAAAGEDPYYGLPGVSTRPRKAQPYVKIGTTTLIFTPYARREILNSTWNSRGWTYQEGLLSIRKLVFTDTQVYFQCNGMHCLESVRVPLEDLHTMKNTRMRDSVDISRVFPLRGLGRTYEDLQYRVNEYLQRFLTFDKDALDAFRGILTGFSDVIRRPLRSIYGIPINAEYSRSKLAALVNGLSWSANAPESKHIKRRPEFPSWTWLGWKDLEVSFQFRDLPSQGLFNDISFETFDGLMVSGLGNKDNILDTDHLGSSPRILHVNGLTLNVGVTPDGCMLGNEDKSLIVEGLQREYFKERVKHALGFIQNTYNIQADDNGFIQFTLLLLRDGFNNNSGVYWECFSLLLLYQPEGSRYFERLNCLELSRPNTGLGISRSNPLGWTARQVSIK